MPPPPHCHRRVELWRLRISLHAGACCLPLPSPVCIDQTNTHTHTPWRATRALLRTRTGLRAQGPGLRPRQDYAREPERHAGTRLCGQVPAGHRALHRGRRERARGVARHPGAISFTCCPALPCPARPRCWTRVSCTAPRAPRCAVPCRAAPCRGVACCPARLAARQTRRGCRLWQSTASRSGGAARSARHPVATA